MARLQHSRRLLAHGPLSAGAHSLPQECMVLGLATRLAQYCIGPGNSISPALVQQFLKLLEWLVALCDEDLPLTGQPL